MPRAKKKAKPKRKRATRKAVLSKAGYPKGGRPPKYQAEFATQAKKLSVLGATEYEIADFLKVDETTLWRWKFEHPLFCKALRLGKAAADKRMENSLYHRGVGYSHSDTHVSVIGKKVVLTPITKHYPPAEGAIKLWLTNRDPRKWRDIKSSVLTTPPGQPMEHRHTYGSTESLAEFYRRAHQESEQVSEAAAADGDPDLGEGDERGP